MKFYKFRIYPENKSLYFYVWIFPSKNDMQRMLHNSDIAKKNFIRTLRACFISLSISKVKANNGSRKHPLCGDIIFWQKDLSVSVTSHEITHAALNWARRIGLNLLQEEERFCSVVGELNRQFVNKCYDWNIYK